MTFRDAPIGEDHGDEQPGIAAGSGFKVTGAAFWATLRTVIVAAMCVDVAYFGFFLYLGVPELAWPNLSSVGLYGFAYLLLQRRSNRLAVGLVWLEVLLHSAAGSLLIGWDSGFHYYLLLFLPMIGIGSRGRATLVLTLLLLAFYLGLNEASHIIGPSNPIAAGPLLAARWFNIVVVFALFLTMSKLYVARVRAAQRQLLYLATHDAATGLLNRRQFTAMVDHEASRRRRTRTPMTLALLYIDVDKRAEGPRADAGLDRRQLGAGHLLRKTCRANDIVGCWSPNVFVIVQPDTPREQTARSIERARRAIEAEEGGCGALMPAGVRMHVGIAEFGFQDDSLASALAQAERQLLEDEGRCSGQASAPVRS